MNMFRTWFKRRDDGLSIPEFPPLESVPLDAKDYRAEEAFAEAHAEIRLLKTMVENLKQRLEEKSAKVRSQGTSLGNRTKTINRLKAKLAAAGLA